MMEKWLDFADFIDHIQELIDIGLHDDALGLLEQYEHIYGEHWEIYYLYSRIFTEQNRNTDAIRALYKAYRLDRNNIDCLVGLFFAFAHQNTIKRAVKFLKKAERIHPNNENVLNALIWYNIETGNYDTAIDYFEKALQGTPENPEIYRNAALAYERIGFFDNAEYCYTKALEINPYFDEVRDLLADHYILSNKADKSISLYRDYLSISPKNIRALSRMVFCLSQNGQIDEASSTARAIIKWYPNSPIGYVDLAYVYLNERDYRTALHNAEKALDVAPYDAEAWRVKALVFVEQQRMDDATGSFQKSLSLDPDNPEIKRDYYHHLRSTGNYDRMRTVVESVISQEYPYCLEDYWFLADYYREHDDNRKAFHYFHKAYSNVPGERELLPPIIDILLDEGHERYSMPFMHLYLQRNGWNETMRAFSRHKRLQSRPWKEGMRLLRFMGEGIGEYRRYIFFHTLRRYICIGSIVVTIPLILFAYLLFGWSAAVIVAITYGGIMSGYGVTRLVIGRNIRKKKYRLDTKAAVA
jgi:Tfp pilus assembly protein PilF